MQRTSGFPADRTPERGAPPAPEGRELVALPAALVARLDRMSRGDADSRHVLLAAGLIALLARYTRDDEVTIGTPARGVPGRLVLPATAGGTFRELLMGLRDTVRAAIRDGGAHPIGGPPAGDAVDVAIALDGLHDVEAVAGVPVLFHATGDIVTVRYDTGRFTPATARQIGRHFVRLLDAATTEPDRPLADLTLWTGDDARVVAAANATGRPFDESATLADLLHRQAAANPAAIALCAGGTALTYSELDARCTGLAHVLRDRGVGPGRIVGVLAERSVDLVVAILGVLRAGGAYLPLDPAYPPARTRYLLADSGATLVVAPPGSGDLDVPTVDPAVGLAGAAPLEPLAGPRDLAYVIYTSGSTGDPKGVLVEHRSVVNRLAWMQRAYPIGPGDVVLQKTSTSFDVSVWELFWWMSAGATLALLEPDGERSPAAILAAVERYRVTTVHFVPSMLAPFLAHLDRLGGTEQLATLRQVFASGEALTPRLARRFAELLPGVRLVNLYGPTEATVDVTHQPVSGVDGLARVPIGSPIDNIRAHVLDGAGHPVPVGMPGELCLAGVGLARGYHGRAELTARRFTAGPAVGEDRLYRTGDLARWNGDGTLDYLGRLDRQVKVRGFRVEPGEIEECLRAHPAVLDASVVDRDDGWQTTLRGFVVPRASVTEEELKRHLRATLPEFLVPGRIVLLAALPLTPNGKLDRAALRRPGAGTGTPYVAPRDDRERVLAAIWAEVLGRPAVGVLDNFFALGGNSIHFVSVLAKARAAGLAFTFQQLFEHQTIAGLAAHVTDVPTGEPAGLAPFALLSEADRARLPDDAEDAYPLSLLQAGLIFQTEITGARGQYHDVLSYLVGGAFDAGRFTEAVRLLAARHPILRTTYHLTGFSEFVQIVHREPPPILSIVDLRGLGPDEQERWHSDWLAAEKRRRFAWAEGGLVTLHVQVLASDRYRYTISQHNSALDGWSISLLHTQLFDTYHRLGAGSGPEPGGGDHHLRTFVGLERAAMRSPASREFWLERMRDRPLSTVPGARPGDTADFRVVLHDVALPAGLTARVVALADELSVPVKDVLLAAHVKVLAAGAGEASIVTGYEHSGRPEDPGAEAALGLYLNTVPLCLDLTDGSWADLVGQVYRAERDLLPHRRYPMAKMKQDLGTQRPLFDTTFNFTHFYLMKRLRELPEFALLELRVDSETEFAFRTEFSRHFFDDELRLCLHYHEHRFDPADIEAIGLSFVAVLELMTAEPAKPHTSWTPVVGPSTVVAEPRVEPRPAAIARRSTVDRLAAVWADVLAMPVRDIAASADFFALGGNSLSALRVVLETDGLVTLTDLMRYPRLDELAAFADRRRQGEPDVLPLLSSTAAGTRCALVCVPYPCGHPINFAPLAAEIEELTSDIAVYAVQEPGHDVSHPGPFAALADTVRLVADRLADRVDVPVLLWGHCGGAAIAVELARRLEADGRDVRGLFLGSKLLPPVPDMRHSITQVETWTDEQLIGYMVDETGYTELDGLDRRHTAFLARVFRHDVGNGFRYLIDRVERPDRPLRTPLTAVVAADDRTLAHQAGEYAGWSLVAADVRLHVVPHGGHYFVRTNPLDCARLVVSAWES